MSGLNERAPIDLIEPRWIVQCSDYVTALAWSPTGTTLAAASAGGPILLLGGSTGEIVHELPGHGIGTLALDWSRDGRRLASGGQDGKARIRDARDGTQILALDGGSSWVEHVAWSPSGNQLATAAGKFLKLRREGGELIQLHDDHNSTVTGLAWFRDARGLATTCYGGAKLWRVGRREAEKHFQRKGSFLSLSLSPDDKHLAAGCQDASLFVWNVKTGKTVGMAGYAGKVGVLGWNAKSRYLASGAGSEAVVWDFSGMIPANCEPLILNGHVDRITDIGFHPTTNTLATAGNDGMLILWQVPEGEMRNLCILTNPLSSGLESAGRWPCRWFGRG